MKSKLIACLCVCLALCATLAISARQTVNPIEIAPISISPIALDAQTSQDVKAPVNLIDLIPVPLPIVSTDLAQKIKELTATAELKHKDGFITRLEYRYDFSDLPFWVNNGRISKHQNTFTIGVIYAVSTKAP